MSQETYKATCQRTGCKYIQFFGRRPGMLSCPECGFHMKVVKEDA